jgi:hypothetical protein
MGYASLLFEFVEGVVKKITGFSKGTSVVGWRSRGDTRSRSLRGGCSFMQSSFIFVYR